VTETKKEAFEQLGGGGGVSEGDPVFGTGGGNAEKNGRNRGEEGSLRAMKGKRW